VKGKGKFRNLTEMLYGGLKTLGGGPVNMQAIHDWLTKNWKFLDARGAERDRQGPNFKANVNNALVSTSIFEKHGDDSWTLANPSQENNKRKKRVRR